MKDNVVLFYVFIVWGKHYLSYRNETAKYYIVLSLCLKKLKVSNQIFKLQHRQIIISLQLRDCWIYSYKVKQNAWKSITQIKDCINMGKKMWWSCILHYV